MPSRIFQKLLLQVNPENERFVAKNLAIRKQVKAIFQKHPTIKSQKDLAKALSKEESEISKWLSGMHNLTLDSIYKMEDVLGFSILITDLQAQKKYGNIARHIQLLQRTENIGLVAGWHGVTRDLDSSVSIMLDGISQRGSVSI